MKHFLTLGLAALALSACGGEQLSGKQAIVDGCIADGESEAICTCVGGVLETHLSTATLDKVAKAVEKEGKTPADQIDSLEPEEQREFIEAAPGLLMCAAGVDGR
jgi:tRNA A37 methylthiotransferase MiaB